MGPPTDDALLAAAMNAAADQAVQPQMVPPQPVPTVVSLTQARAGNGELLVAVQFSTPVGMHVFFLDQAAARKIGADMQRAGSEGIVIAGADQLPKAS